MTDKVKFKTSGKIKMYILASFLILLAGTTQTSAQKLNLYVFTLSNDKNNKKALAVEDWLKGQIEHHFRDKYPCADILTDKDVRNMLEFEKQRQLLGSGDENLLAEIGNTLGSTQYVVSVSVTQNNTSYLLNALGMDTKRAKVVARETTYVQDEDGVPDAANSLAEKLVSEMVNSLPDCYENEWIGTITYHRERHAEGSTTENHLVFDDVKKTTEITSQTIVDADLQVRGTNRPARAFVKCNEESTTNITLRGTVKCGGATPFDEPRTVPLNSTDVTKVTGKAEGRSDEARVSVSVSGDEFTISLSVPQIEDGTAVRDWTMKESGGCGDPVNKHENTSYSFTTFEETGQVNGTIDPANPDLLAGSKTIKIPEEYGIKETKLITWDLRFIRKPSLGKIK